MNSSAPPLEASLSVHAAELFRLDRYERRALSRRKAAIRAFDAHRPQLPALDEDQAVGDARAYLFHEGLGAFLVVRRAVAQTARESESKALKWRRNQASAV